MPELTFVIERCASIAQPGWLAMRQALWPHCSTGEQQAEMSLFLESPARYAQFVAYARTGEAVGFIEASVRTDYVNATRSARVAFLEGVYVVPQVRRRSSLRTQRWKTTRVRLNEANIRQFRPDAEFHTSEGCFITVMPPAHCQRGARRSHLSRHLHAPLHQRSLRGH